jgi:hypothetical protein
MLSNDFLIGSEIPRVATHFSTKNCSDGMIRAQTGGLMMDCVLGQGKLPGLSPKITHQVKGRRLKVYVEALGSNVYLINPGGRRLSLALKISLSQHGITMGWKMGAKIWDHDVYLPQIYLMMLAEMGAGRAGVRRHIEE